MVGTKLSRVDAVTVDIPAPADPTEGTPPLMSDSYYELIDPDDARGEKFAATDLVRSTWSAKIQHGAPVSALLVRALERCEQRDDTRLSRVIIDLMGGVPAEGDLWVSARVERAGKQIELVSAEMLALGPDGTPPGREGQRVADADAGHRRRCCMRRPRHCVRCRKPAAATWPRTGTATTCTAWTGAG